MSDTDFAPSESSPSPESQSSGTESAIQSVKDVAYDALTRSETASTEDWVDETRAREAEERGEEPSAHQKRERAGRIQKALEEATREVPSNDHEAPEARQEASPDWESQLRARDDSIRKVTQFQMREAEHAKSSPDYYAMRDAILSTWPINDHVAGVILDSPVGPQIVELLVNNPNPGADGIAAIEYLNSIPAAQAVREIARLEGQVIERMNHQQPQQPARRATQAKAPIRPLNGGSSSPSSSWADSDNMDVFAKGLQRDQAARRGRGRRSTPRPSRN